MVVEKLQQAVGDIKEHRNEIINNLINFSKTDSLLFWDTDENIAKKQEQVWGPIMQWVGEMLHAQYVTTNNLDVPMQKANTLNNFKMFLENMSDKELAAFYLAALNMRSGILAAALVKGKINAKQAFEASALEELVQSEHWGKDKLAEERRKSMLDELKEIEKFLKQ